MTDWLLRIYGIASALPWWLLCLGLAGLVGGFVLLRVKKGRKIRPPLWSVIVLTCLIFVLTGQALSLAVSSRTLWLLAWGPLAVFLLQLLLLLRTPYRSIRLFPLLLSAAEALWGIAVVLTLPFSQPLSALGLFLEQGLPSLLPLLASLLAFLAGKLGKRHLRFSSPSPEGRGKALCVSLALLALLLGPRLVSLNETSLRKGLSDTLSKEDFILTENPRTLRLTVDEGAVLKIDGLAVVESDGEVYTCGGERLGKVYTVASGKKCYQIHAYPCEISQSTQVKAEYLKKQATDKAESCYELRVNTALAVRVHQDAHSAPAVLPNLLLWP